ncbi:MAG TPA: TraR/DksA C4-type zinc finger protein [Sporosarcina sp.]|nr:TraR/DksA C4-type zinc finger protein [Sporosarcina sp.]
MLTDRQINHLKTLLIEMKTEYEASEQLDDDEESMRHASGELSMYDNHPADMGTELYERERDQALEVHAASELDKVEQALQAIENGTYGICEICHQSIGYERLEAIPFTTLCIDHANMKEALKEEQPQVEIDDPFNDTRDKRAQDMENSFEEVADFGTSDTISDEPEASAEDIDDHTIEKDEYERATNKYSKNRYHDEYEDS